jgi:hypothetical protein
MTASAAPCAGFFHRGRLTPLPTDLDRSLLLLARGRVLGRILGRRAVSAATTAATSAAAAGSGSGSEDTTSDA